MGVPVTDHFYATLSKSEIGRNSAFGAHICFKYAQQIHLFHDYTPKVEQSMPTFIPAPVQIFPQILNDASSNFMSSAMVKQNELPLIIPQPPAYETESKNMEIDINNKLTPKTLA